MNAAANRIGGRDDLCREFPSRGKRERRDIQLENGARWSFLRFGTPSWGLPKRAGHGDRTEPAPPACRGRGPFPDVRKCTTNWENTPHTFVALMQG